MPKPFSIQIRPVSHLLLRPVLVFVMVIFALTFAMLCFFVFEDAETALFFVGFTLVWLITQDDD